MQNLQLLLWWGEAMALQSHAGMEHPWLYHTVKHGYFLCFSRPGCSPGFQRLAASRVRGNLVHPFLLGSFCPILTIPKRRLSNFQWLMLSYCSPSNLVLHSVMHMAEDKKLDLYILKFCPHAILFLEDISKRFNPWGVYKKMLQSWKLPCISLIILSF